MPKINIIYGCGYAGREIKMFIGTLNKNNIEILVDIRSFPVSRHFPQFSRNILSKALREAGIAYKYEGRRIGGKLANVGFDECVDELSEMARLGTNIVLMCAEMKPENCHRTSILKPALAKRGIELMELNFPQTQNSFQKYGKGRGNPSQSEVKSERTSPKGSPPRN